MQCHVLVAWVASCPYLFIGFNWYNLSHRDVCMALHMLISYDFMEKPQI